MLRRIAYSRPIRGAFVNAFRRFCNTHYCENQNKTECQCPHREDKDGLFICNAPLPFKKCETKLEKLLWIILRVIYYAVIAGIILLPWYILYSFLKELFEGFMG